MTLLAIRKQFVEFSGRFDLVTDLSSYADKGADKFIRAGQQWLDSRYVIHKTLARWFSTIAIDSWYALVPSCRSIQEVWMSNSTNDKWRLNKLLLHELRLEDPNDPSDIDSGQPLYYSITSLREIPQVTLQSIVDKYGVNTYSSAVNDYNYTGIIWLPPVDESTTLEIVGDFFQPTLSNDGDTNYWSEIHSFNLVLAACRSLEMSYRNLAGVNDWEESIERNMRGVEFDLVDQESHEVHYMKG